LRLRNVGVNALGICRASIYQMLEAEKARGEGELR